MKHLKLTFLLTVLISMVGTRSYAHDLENKNADGITIYYKWINNKTELAVTYIGKDMFKFSDRYVGNVVIPESVTHNGNNYSVTQIDYGAFFKCDKLTSVTITNSVTTINEVAFAYCDELTSVTIPNSVTTIGYRAFFDCKKITKVTIPKSVTYIGEFAFWGCKELVSINVENGNQNYDSRNNCNAIIETKSNSLIAGCKITVIPNNVTSIGNGAFAYISTLTSITIPNNVTTIGESAFNNCDGLESVVIPNSVTTISSMAFKECSKLTNVSIGDCVKFIGYNAFCNCTALTRIISNAITPPECSSEVFYNVNKKICTLSVPKGSIGAYQYANQWKEFYHIDDNLTGISNLTKGIATPNHIYDLNGRKLKEPKKGINIIGRKKVVMK